MNKYQEIYFDLLKKGNNSFRQKWSIEAKTRVWKVRNNWVFIVSFYSMCTTQNIYSWQREKITSWWKSLADTSLTMGPKLPSPEIGQIDTICTVMSHREEHAIPSRDIFA